MIYFRSALFKIGQGLSLVPFCIIALLAIPLPPRLRSKVIASWSYFVTWWLKTTCGLRFKVIGLENIPEQPCVLVSNHQSDWETIIPQTFLPPMSWVLKKELLRIPFFGWGLWASRPIAIDRQDQMNALDQVVTQGKDRLNEGRHVLIFPEGTRMPYKKPGKYKRGGVKLARAANVQIVPIAHNAGKFWPRNSWLIRSGVVECRIGKPIALDISNDREITAQLKTWIEEQHL